ncbi:hypothetical protein EVAR_87772_1 [Eumeta japonica]|uniref:Uncharacterized protein n=1 Tax=Eumeta variegata TaxID=151549 RepID=A0A4C1X7H5_EUMVA|nr:hypothetical protein EVAR_87772_1 [Eumeta japonica]
MSVDFKDVKLVCTVVIVRRARTVGMSFAYELEEYLVVFVGRAPAPVFCVVEFVADSWVASNHTGAMTTNSGAWSVFSKGRETAGIATALESRQRFELSISAIICSLVCFPKINMHLLVFKKIWVVVFM